MQGEHSRGENTDSLKKNIYFSRRRLRNLKRTFKTVGTWTDSIQAGDPEQGSGVAAQTSKEHMYPSWKNYKSFVYPIVKKPQSLEDVPKNRRPAAVQRTNKSTEGVNESRSMVILIIMVSTGVETIIINITIERDSTSQWRSATRTATSRRQFGLLRTCPRLMKGTCPS